MRCKALLLVLIVVGASLLILASAPSEVKAAPHDPIYIDSDAELESMAGVEGWAGSGSAVDPFIIENYTIDAENASNGIRIRNIDHHILIRNCVVHNTSDDVSIPSGGINLTSVENATIEYCEVYDSFNGICLYECTDILVKGNDLHDNGNIGVDVGMGSRVNVTNNTIARSASYGISLEDCTGVQVYGNILIDNNGADDTFDAAHTQASDSSATANQWNSTGTPVDYGNLWTDWLSPDNDKNGFVDSPYLLAGGAQDNAPLADAAPELQILTPTNLGALNTQYAQITWQGWDNGSGIFGYYLNIDDAPNWVDVGTNTSYNWAPISEGVHEIKVNATDHAGLITVASVQFYVDRTAPVVTFLSPSNSTHTNQSVAVVNWSGSDATAVKDYQVRINAYPWTTTTATTFTTPTMSQGWNQVWINATDTAGNWAISYLQIFVDTEGPQIEIISPASGILVGDSSVNIVWTTEDLGEGVELCEIRIDNGPWVNVTGTTSYLASNLIENPNGTMVLLQAFDGLGNKASTSIILAVDLYAPSVSITSPANNTSTSSSSILLQWTGSDSSGFGVNRYEVQIDSGTWNNRGKDTAWAITNLLEGKHTLRVRAFDNVGRNSTDLVVVISDDDGPSISIDNIAEGQTLTMTQINVTWTAFDGGSDITRFEVRLDAGGWQERGLEQWVVLELTEGRHNLTVRGYDHLDNIGQDMVNFTVDISAPTVAITYPTADAMINNKTVEVFYVVSDPSGIRWLNYSVDGKVWTRVNYPSDHVTLNISDGPVRFALKAVDLVGWERTAWSNFTRDSTAPAVTSYSPNGTSVPTGSIITISLNEDIRSDSLSILVDGVKQAYIVSGRTYNVSIVLILGHTYIVSAQGGTDIAGNRMGNFSWTFTTPTTGTITGRVVDSDGDPIKDAYVRAGSYSALTDFQGDFLLSLPSGSYNLTITASGMEDETIPIEVDGDESLGDLTMGSSSGGMDMLLIGAILAVVAVIAIAAFLIIRRTKR